MRLFRLVILLTAAAIVVFSAGMALGQPPANPANPVRALPDTVERGETFNITVNFTAPANNFTGIALTDYAPTVWNIVNVSGMGAWSEPPAKIVLGPPNNVVSFSWLGPTGGYNISTNFSAKYKIKVPCDANLTNYTFDSGNDAYLMYTLGNSSGNSSLIWENITGNSTVTVVPPAICSTPSIPIYAANGTNPQNKTLELWSSTPCWLNWNLTDDANYTGANYTNYDWLSENIINGSCNYTERSFVNLSVNSSGMPRGNYTANITIEAPYPEANNSPRIVPVTLHITLTGTLEGHVSFYRAAGPGDPTWETPLVVEFFDNSTKAPMTWSPINVTPDDAYGNFTIGDIVVGTYDIGVKNYTTLSKMAYGKNFTAGSLTPINFGVLVEADCDNNDMSGSADYAKVLNNYGAMEIANSTFWEMYELWKADYNRDKIIGSSDYASVLNNYGQNGDIFYYTH